MFSSGLIWSCIARFLLNKTSLTLHPTPHSFSAKYSKVALLLEVFLVYITVIATVLLCFIIVCSLALLLLVLMELWKTVLCESDFS